MELNQIIIESTAIITKYKQLPSSYNNIDSLIHNRKNLTCLSFELAKLVGENRAEFDTFHFLRKAAVSKEIDRQVTNLKKSISYAKETVYKDPVVKREFKNEKDAEGIFRHGDFLLKQINEVSSAMSQQISYLKDERRRINFTQTT